MALFRGPALQRCLKRLPVLMIVCRVALSAAVSLFRGLAGNYNRATLGTGGGA